MEILITGDYQLISRLLIEAEKAIKEEGQYSISIEDEKGRTLNLSFEGTEEEGLIEWEQM